MGLEVTGRAKPLVAYIALMRLFTSVNQVVFLQVGKLGEAFVTGFTLEWSLSSVDPQMNLKKQLFIFIF